MDIDEVRSLVGSVKHHREKDPSTGKPIRRTAGVSTGTLLSYHGHTKAKANDRTHRVRVVDEIVKNDAGQVSLIYTRKGDWETGIIYEAENLADSISKGKCHIESPDALLGVLMFHFTHTEHPELALSLAAWAGTNGFDVPDMMEKEGDLVTVAEPRPEPAGSGVESSEPDED